MPKPRVKQREPGQLRRGRVAIEEEDYIRANCGSKSDQEIAEFLGRSPELIKKWREEVMYGGIEQPDVKRPLDPRTPVEFDSKVVRRQLTRRPEWKQYQKHFTSEELDQFEAMYVQFFTQFKGDILPTEEMQLFKLIEMEIYASRVKSDALRAYLDVEDLQKVLDKHKKDEPTNLEKRIQLETSLATAKSLHDRHLDQYKKMSDANQAVLKLVKGSRDQRIEKPDSQRVDYISMIKQLEEDEYREREGFQLGLMKKAVEKERGRLGNLHKFPDGEIDRPLLNCDTVMREDSEVLEPQEGELSGDEDATDE